MTFGIPKLLEKVVAEARAQPLTSAEYKQLAEALELPTIQQMKQFADFVCTAHSWYKHLPLLAPGRPFIFFC